MVWDGLILILVRKERPHCLFQASTNQGRVKDQKEQVKLTRRNFFTNLMFAGKAVSAMTVCYPWDLKFDEDDVSQHLRGIEDER
jgi:hypothetical protein